MANITFISPKMKKEATVYAVAGDRGTLLSVAQAHKIPIPFDCRDGECGSCLVEVEIVDKTKFRGINMAPKEMEMLKQLGKITPEEQDLQEVRNIPPRHRLACQFFVRDEDIIVSFGGDEVLPNPRPPVTAAASWIKGGLIIQSMDHFLACSVKVEQEAAEHYDGLARDMKACGNETVAELFSKLAHYSRLHHKEALERAGNRDLTHLMPEDHSWPTLETPEQTTLFAGDPEMSKRDALKVALEGERRAFEFYHQVAQTVGDKEIRKVANEFVKEESEHVAVLERWIAGEEAQLA